MDIDANTYCLVLPYYGDQKDQAKNDEISEELIKKNIISNQRSVITYTRVNTYGIYTEQMPTAKRYLCPRAPITRSWYNEIIEGTDDKGNKISKEIVGDQRGIPGETMNSIGCTIGYTLTFYVTDPVKYFYYKAHAGEFTSLVDREGYAAASKAQTAYLSSHDEMSAIKDKMVLCKNVTDAINDTFNQFGVEVRNVSIKGGIIWDNKDIQTHIDARMIAAVDKAGAQDQVDAEKKKAEMVNYKRLWAEIDLIEAKAKYINAAAEKGINLVPQIQAGNSGLILDIGNGLKSPSKDSK